MILLQCVTAYVAVQQMMETEWDYQTAYGLLCLKRKLQPHAEFYGEKEMELVRAHGQRDAEGNVALRADGSFVFETPEAAAEYARRRRDLGAVEVSVDWEILHLPRPEKIKPAQLEALAGFVEFGK